MRHDTSAIMTKAHDFRRDGSPISEALRDAWAIAKGELAEAIEADTPAGCTINLTINIGTININHHVAPLQVERAPAMLHVRYEEN